MKVLREEKRLIKQVQILGKTVFEMYATYTFEEDEPEDDCMHDLELEYVVALVIGLLLILLGAILFKTVWGSRQAGSGSTPSSSSMSESTTESTSTSPSSMAPTMTSSSSISSKSSTMSSLTQSTSTTTPESLSTTMSTAHTAGMTMDYSSFSTGTSTSETTRWADRPIFSEAASPRKPRAGMLFWN